MLRRVWQRFLFFAMISKSRLKSVPSFTWSFPKRGIDRSLVISAATMTPLFRPFQPNRVADRFEQSREDLLLRRGLHHNLLALPAAFDARDDLVGRSHHA